MSNISNERAIVSIKLCIKNEKKLAGGSRDDKYQEDYEIVAIERKN